MKLNRAIISFAIGILITNIVGIAINIIYGTTENYAHTAPGLNQMVGNSFNATIFQFVLSGLLGMYFEVTAKVWEKGYKPLKAFLVQYAFVIPVALLVAYLCFWMQHTFSGFIIYFVIYTIIYSIVQYLVYVYTKNASKNESK